MNQSMSAPVSVIIPCYRCAGTIERAVASVAAQTLKPAEVILVDDASGDDTLDSLHALRQHYAEGWIQVIALPQNRGAASARNAGWSAATQPYIAFLDADDSWHPHKIELQYNVMRAHPETALSGHGWQLPQAPMDISPTPAVSDMGALRLALSNPFVTPSVMLKAELPFRFRDGQRHMEDHLLWLEIVLTGHKAMRIDAPLAVLHKRFGDSGLSAQLWSMQKANFMNWWYLWRMRRLGLLPMLGMMLFSLVKYIRRLAIFMACTMLGSRKS